MEPKSYVTEDEHGALRVVGTRVMLDSIVAPFEQGHSPETIVQQYPSLTLEGVYGAIAWYLANREEADRYLKRQADLWEDWRRKADQTANPVVRRMRTQTTRAGADAE
ncbi:MAG: DUF433 domain-containing protein [Thermoguttaceae bacterium]